MFVASLPLLTTVEVWELRSVNAVGQNAFSFLLVKALQLLKSAGHCLSCSCFRMWLKFPTGDRFVLWAGQFSTQILSMHN